MDDDYDYNEGEQSESQEGKVLKYKIYFNLFTSVSVTLTVFSIPREAEPYQFTETPLKHFVKFSASMKRNRKL